MREKHSPTPSLCLTNPSDWPAQLVDSTKFISVSCAKQSLRQYEGCTQVTFWKQSTLLTVIMFACDVATVNDFRCYSLSLISQKSLPMLKELCRMKFIHMKSWILNIYLISIPTNAHTCFFFTSKRLKSFQHVSILRSSSGSYTFPC